MTEKRMIPPPIPPSPNARLDARTRAERKSEEQAKQHANDKDAKHKQADIEGNKEKEHGGPAGLEPTRYGDWERAGRCIDF